MKHNKQACKIIGCGQCDTTANEILRNISKDKCRLCGERTRTHFNIHWIAVPVCESCAMSITKQQIASL